MQRFAVIADIHSNALALEAILKDIEQRGVRQVLNLGDIFYGPIAPRATFELLENRNFPTILGNQDRLLFEANAAHINSNRTLEFVLKEITFDGLDWLNKLPAIRAIDDRILLCHGAPESDLIYLLEDVNSGQPTLKTDAGIMANLKGVQEEVILCGHTHIPRTTMLSSGQIVLNPGSVGMPAYEDDLPCAHKMETGSPHARYAILSCSENGWITEHIQASYDFEAAAKMAERNGRADWASLIRTGRV